MGRLTQILGEILGGILILVVFTELLDTVAAVGLTPQSGDPFFPAWVDITRYGWKALLLVIPGVAVAASAVLRRLPSSNGF